ncbi:MAG: hypothetical protein EOO24_02115 [Comamonadaceae bacterium]|nr:MAG: hypothetical protein EOO24_02115 [Comamonadaceae bacterium]
MLALALAFGAWGSVMAADVPQQPLPLPRDVRVEIIGDDMRFNGAPMQIVRFDTEDEARTEAFYRDFFARHGQGNKSSMTGQGDGRLLAGMYQGRLITAEFQAQDGRAGSVLLSSIELGQLMPPAQLATQWPRLPGTEVLQVIESRDGAIRNSVTSMRNSQSVEGNAAYLRAEMLRLGWTRQRDETERTQVARQLMFSKEGRDSLIDIRRLPSGETYLIVNETRR